MALGILLNVYDRNFKFQHYTKDVLQPFRDVQSIVGKLLATKAAIDGDPKLTSAGKDRAKADAGIASLKAINAWLTPKFEALTADLTARRAAMPALPQPDPAKVNAMLSKLQSFTPEERAVLYNSATTEEQQLMRSAHAIAGRMPMKSANGLEWTHLLDPAMVAESEDARLAAAHPDLFQRMQELSELRDMHRTVANQASADVREALALYNLEDRIATTA
jgi:hypothetical protein